MDHEPRAVWERYVASWRAESTEQREVGTRSRRTCSTFVDKFRADTPDLESYGAEYHPTREDSVLYYAIPIV